MIDIEDLPFTHNWNNKLDCKAFTTIRLYNPNKHIVGVKKRIVLKRTEVKGIGVITAVKPFLLSQMNAFISFLDTGYNVEQCTNVILKMYPSVDFKTKKLALLLIVKEGIQ